MSRFNKIVSVVFKALESILNLGIFILTETRRPLEFIRLAHVDFNIRPDDIFIVTYPRSGTTWMQMILYQLTTDGKMNFPHISKVCPWP